MHWKRSKSWVVRDGAFKDNESMAISVMDMNYELRFKDLSRGQMMFKKGLAKLV
jgi:hypothetical protein